VTVTLELPDDIAQILAAQGDLSRHALEPLAVDGYRQKTLTQAQVGRLLGLARIDTEEFLARHVNLYDYSAAELEAEADLLHRLTG
jgi:predicted HTH domain antitoxin